MIELTNTKQWKDEQVLNYINRRRALSLEYKGLSLIQFGSLEPFVLHEHRLPNRATQERSFLVNVFDKLVVNMTSCFEVQEEPDEENGRQGNSLGEIGKTLVAL